MTISRLDRDGIGSPTAIANRIHELMADMPTRVPVEQLCKPFDISSIEEIDTDGFEAALIMDELKAAGAILLASGRSQQRRLFSIGHELGHFLIPSHRPSAHRPFQCSLADLHHLDVKSRDRHKQIEAEANRFAAHLLMPPKRIRRAVGQLGVGLESIVAVARDFGASKEAMARAWVDGHSEPVAIVIAKDGRVARVYRNEDFPWLAVKYGERIPSGSIAQEAATSPGIYSAIEKAEPDVWLGERDAVRTLILTEQVLSQQNGYALILLQAELDED